MTFSDGLFCSFVGGVPAFDKFHEALAYMLRYSDVSGPSAPVEEVFVGLEGSRCSQNADDARSGAEGCRLDCGLHTDESGVREFCSKGRDGCRSGRIARNYDDVRSL